MGNLFVIVKWLHFDELLCCEELLLMMSSFLITSSWLIVLTLMSSMTVKPFSLVLTKCPFFWVWKYVIKKVWVHYYKEEYVHDDGIRSKQRFDFLTLSFLLSIFPRRRKRIKLPWSRFFLFLFFSRRK